MVTELVHWFLSIMLQEPNSKLIIAHIRPKVEDGNTILQEKFRMDGPASVCTSKEMEQPRVPLLVLTSRAYVKTHLSTRRSGGVVLITETMVLDQTNLVSRVLLQVMMPQWELPILLVSDEIDTDLYSTKNTIYLKHLAQRKFS